MLGSPILDLWAPKLLEKLTIVLGGMDTESPGKVRKEGGTKGKRCDHQKGLHPDYSDNFLVSKLVSAGE